MNHSPPFKVPHLIQWRRWARNGMVVTPHDVVYHALNHIAAYRVKAVSMAVPLDAVPSGVTGTALHWPFAMRLSPATTHIRARVGIVPAQSGAGSVDPAVYLKITDGLTGGTAIDSNVLHYPSFSAAASFAPNDIHWAWCEATIGVAGANQSYRLELYTEDFGRLHCAQVYEHVELPLSDATDHAVRQTIGVGQAITDADYQDALVAADAMWSGQAGNLITWCRKSAATAPTRDNTTFTNILDGTSTTVTAATPGFRPVNFYHNSLSATTVNVRLAVRAELTSGTGTGEVRVTDGTNTMTVTGITTAGWYSTTGAWPVSGATGTKTDIHARVTPDTGAGDVMRVDGVYLWEEE